ncbi:MAG: hypothetical protein AAF205_00030 [Pseudomonadota bacterium]
MAGKVRTFRPFLPTLTYVAARMRERDVREFGCLGDATPMQRANGFQHMPLITVLGRERPEIVIGGGEVMPGVWWAAAYATDKFASLKLSATKAALRLINEARERGGRRVETRVLTSHVDSVAWLEFLGFHIEATFPFGMNGEEFHQCAMPLVRC